MDISWPVLSFWGYSTCKVNYIQVSWGGKIKLCLWQTALPIFAEVAEKVSASSCSSSFSARGYKACNSSSNMNKCQLLAQQLMACPSWPELFNSHRLSVRSPSFMGGKGLCHRHRSVIGNRVFPNFDRIEIIRSQNRDWCLFLFLFLVDMYNFFQLSHSIMFLFVSIQSRVLEKKILVSGLEKNCISSLFLLLRWTGEILKRDFAGSSWKASTPVQGLQELNLFSLSDERLKGALISVIGTYTLERCLIARCQPSWQWYNEIYCWEMGVTEIQPWNKIQIPTLGDN